MVSETRHRATGWRALADAIPVLDSGLDSFARKGVRPPSHVRLWASLRRHRGSLLVASGRRFPLLRRNNSLIRGANTPALGVRAWGDIMTDSEWWKERRNLVARYRAMERETTDPLAARLLHDIVLDLEAELEGLRQSVGLDAAA